MGHRPPCAQPAVLPSSQWPHRLLLPFAPFEGDLQGALTRHSPQVYFPHGCGCFLRSSRNCIPEDKAESMGVFKGLGRDQIILRGIMHFLSPCPHPPYLPSLASLSLREVIRDTEKVSVTECVQKCWKSGDSELLLPVSHPPSLTHIPPHVPEVEAPLEPDFIRTETLGPPGSFHPLPASPLPSPSPGT